MTEGHLLRRTAVIWIILEILAATQVRGPDGATVLFSWVRSAIRPVASVGRAFALGGNDIRVGFADSRRLASENHQLRNEVEDLSIRVALLRADLEAALQTNTGEIGLPRFSGHPARCVFRDLGTGLMQVVTRPGARGAIRVDMPVVGPGGVVGRVFRTGVGNPCWVQTVTNSAAAVAVATVDGGVRGLAEGTGGPLLNVRFVSRRTSIMVGDALFTSGADGIYPPGLPVAEVSRVRESPDPFLDIRARPFIDLAVLQSVWLVDLESGDLQAEQP